MSAVERHDAVVPVEPSQVTTLSLRPGTFREVRARVALRNEQHVLLDIDGQKYSAVTDADLEAGEVVWLRVKAVGQDRIELERLRAETPSQSTDNHDLERILLGFGLQATNQEKALAAWMLTHGLGVDERLLKAALTAWHGGALTPPHQEALLFAGSLGLPVSATSLAALSTYLAVRDAWASQLQQTLDALVKTQTWDQFKPPADLAPLLDKAKTLLASYQLEATTSPESLSLALERLLGPTSHPGPFQDLRVLYRALVSETDLPYEHHDHNSFQVLAGHVLTLLESLETLRLLNLSHRLRDEHGRQYVKALFAPWGTGRQTTELRIYPPPHRAPGSEKRVQDFRFVIWAETEKLGTLKLEAHWENGALCLVATTERTAVTEWVHKHVPSLRERLQGLGVALKSCLCETDPGLRSNQAGTDSTLAATDSVEAPPDDEKGVDRRA